MSQATTFVVENHTSPRSAKIGMWLFLFTELLLFGGMFLAYSVYRMKYPTDFHNAASDLNTYIGAINTIILLTSSLTMVLSIATLERGKKKMAITFLVITILLGAAFLVNKYFEWSVKFEHGLYPGAEELSNRSHGEIMFFGLYFVMTGLHGIHVILGMIALSVLLVFIIKNPYERIKLFPHQLGHLNGTQLCIKAKNGETVWSGAHIDPSVRYVTMTVAYDDDRAEKISHSDLIKLENAGLYWHLVDIIWIFLFPLFYLIT